MPPTRKVISDEERRARALERKQAQRERARQQTIQNALSHPDQVQIVDFPSCSAPGSTITTAIPIPTRTSGHSEAGDNNNNHHPNTGDNDEASAATLEQAGSDTSPRYRLRSRSSKSPMPANLCGGPAFQAYRSEIGLERVAEGPGKAEEAAPTVDFTLALRPRPDTPPSPLTAGSATKQPQRASQSTREAANGLAAGRMRRYRHRQRNNRAEEHLAEAERSDGIRVLPWTDAVDDDVEVGPVEPPEPISLDAGDETLTLTRSVIYVSSSSSSPPTPSSANSAASLGPAAPKGSEDTDTGDGVSASTFHIDIGSDNEDSSRERRRPSDASETLRSQPSTPGYGSGDGADGAQPDNVDPPVFQDNSVEDNGAGQTATPHSSTATTTASLDNESPLANAIRAITLNETPAGLVFIEAQAATYRTIFERAFPLLCPCSGHDTSGPQTHREQFFSAKELSNWLRREEALGDLNTILDPKQPHKQRNHERNDDRMRPQEWERFLSNAPRNLSLQRTERTLPANSIPMERVWDGDSFWLGAKSLGAIGRNAVLRLSVIPPFTQSISGEQVVQPHGINLAHTRHSYLGFFTAGGLSFSVFVFFPRTQGQKRNRNSYKGAKPPPFTLSLERRQDFIDGALLPALRATVPGCFRQEAPSTHEIAYARQMSHQERPGTSRWRADDESRAKHLRYYIPGRFLEGFWDELCRRCDGLVVQPQDGSQAPFPYFAQPKLLFQVHDTKNILAGESVADVLDMFCEQVLSCLRVEHLDFRSCWVDIGFRDMPSSYAENDRDAPVTLLWKTKCHEHYNTVIKNASAPDMGLRSECFRTYGLRDVAGYKTKARSTRVVSSPLDPGNPHCTKLGVACAKAYHCNKEELAVIDRDYRLFGSEHLSALALPDEMITQLFSAGHNTARAVCSAPSRQSLQQAWDANRRHLHAVQSNQEDSINCYAVRKEITFRLDVILWMHSHGAFSAAPGRLALGEATRATLQPAYRPDQHYPFWILPTKEVNDLKVSLACRFIKPLNHIFSLAPHLADHGGETRAVIYYYTAQLFTRLLLLSLTSERDYSYDNWIWKDHWHQKKKQGRQQVTYRRKGLGLESAINSTGVIWFGRSQIDWIHSHLSLALLRQLYIPRSPGHAVWSAQAVTRDFSRAIVASVFLVRSLLQRAQYYRTDGRVELAVNFESCAARVAAQEIARSYQKHFLEKLEQFWKNGVIPAHRSPKAFRQMHGNGPESLVNLIGIIKAASGAKAVTAADINAIMKEGLAVFDDPDQDDVAQVRIEIGPRTRKVPVWMQQRGNRSQNPGAATIIWTDKVYNVLFSQHGDKIWGQAKFLQDYNCFKAVFNAAKSDSCPTFDETLQEVIGGFILVMFNSDKFREVGVDREFAPLPTFFRIQFWAPAWDYVTRPTDQPSQRNDRLVAKELFNTLSVRYSDQRRQLETIKHLRSESPTTTKLRQAVRHGSGVEIQGLIRRIQHVYRLLQLLYVTAKHHSFHQDSEETVQQQPWWFKRPAMDRLLVPVENRGVPGMALPTLLYPTLENFQWLTSLSKRLLCVRHIVEGELGDRLPTIDINEWTNTLGDLQRLTVKVDRLLGSGRALMMPQKLESDCAYEILTNEEQSLAEQDSLLLSFLMTTKPPEERREQVRDSQPSDS